MVERLIYDNLDYVVLFNISMPNDVKYCHIEYPVCKKIY